MMVYNFQQPRNLFPYPPVFPNIPVAIAGFEYPHFPAIPSSVFFVHRSAMVFFLPQKKSKHPKLYSKCIT